MEKKKGEIIEEKQKKKNNKESFDFIVHYTNGALPLTELHLVLLRVAFKPVTFTWTIPDLCYCSSSTTSSDSDSYLTVG